MTKPTHARKRWRVGRYIAEGRGPDEIDNAILADYAPLSEERRAELEKRAASLGKRLFFLEGVMATPCTDDERAKILEEIIFRKRWLAEIDAELEGSQ